MSTDTPKVYAAINAVQSAMAREGISKDRKNAQQGYSFRGIDDVYAALSPHLAAQRLCILPRVIDRQVIERETKNGGNLFYTTLKVEFDFVAVEDGSKHTVTTVGEAMDSGDKSSNKAMSAAYKYACFQAFAIPTEGDNDPDNTTHEVAPRARTTPSAPSSHRPIAVPSSWRDAVVAFGKNKGKKLGDLPTNSLVWYIENFLTPDGTAKGYNGNPPSTADEALAMSLVQARDELAAASSAPRKPANADAEDVPF